MLAGERRSTAAANSLGNLCRGAPFFGGAEANDQIKDRA
jgi:hypothetical protein